VVVVEFIELAPGIVKCTNVLLEIEDFYKDLEDAIQVSKLVEWTPATAFDNNGNPLPADQLLRDVDSIGISFNYPDNPENFRDAALKELSTYFSNRFIPILGEYSRNYGIELSEFDTYQVLKYSVGQRFGNHMDESAIYHRRVSMIYYPNDDYQGGEIEFPRFNVKVKPDKCDLIIHPSTFVYNKIIHPVTEGTKYEVTLWAK
jgi:hypothetical protein